MQLVEIAILVGAVSSALTYCLVKSLAQLEQSRCSEISCCCLTVHRDTYDTPVELEVEKPVMIQSRV